MFYFIFKIPGIVIVLRSYIQLKKRTLAFGELGILEDPHILPLGFGGASWYTSATVSTTVSVSE